MKKFIIGFITLVLAIVGVITLTACTDSFGRPSDYVEAERLTVDKASVYLSPSGETSSYQLKVNVLPENATNQKLNYYIPSEYLQYLRVTSSGLLSATGQTVPENTIIPVTVTSTTNKNASLIVSVTIEYVAVREIEFEPGKIELLYNGEGYKAAPIFTPYHAQDGRAVSYRSLNDKVATVDSTGFVTPVSAGGTYILCESTTASGRKITGRLEVAVVYTEGRYRLEVSDRNPQYNQVLGNFKAINFNLMSLDPHSDPDVRILWFVDDKRVESLGLDARQYEHIPNVESRTSYRIKVEITSNYEGIDKAPKVLYSELITIYAKFRGFGLNYDNLTSALGSSYRYGEQVTFTLTEGQSSVVGYKWYLKRKTDAREGKLIAYTSASDRNLTRTINVEGDYTLTAKGVDNEGKTVTVKDFDFSSTKFVAGDTVIAEPYLFEYGAPPETYNYFLAECNTKGEIIGETQAIGHSSNGEKFFYTINNAGLYKIVANATLNGVPATVTETTNGKENEVEFVYSSELIKVCGIDEGHVDFADGLVSNDELGENYKEKLNLIDDVTITGLYDGKDYRVLLTWDAPLGVEDYTVEIKKGGRTVLYNDGDGFGNRYFLVPAADFTLNDAFEVRIKADGSLYSKTYYYNATEEETRNYARINPAYYSYLSPVNGVTTRYLRNMKELGTLLSYISNYSPNNADGIVYGLETIDSARYKSFRFNVIADFDLAKADDYFDGTVPEEIADSVKGIYKAVLGTQNAYCVTGIYRYMFGTVSDGGYSITMLIPDENGLKEDTAATVSGYVSSAYSATPYGNDYGSHAIDARKTKEVSTSEQLYKAVEEGYKPYFTADSVRVLYEKALRMVNSIIGEEMTDAEKAAAFFDYLTINVTYDRNLADLTAGGGEDFYYYPGFRLEGVFDNNKAVCDGISKAFVLLCGIEGIKCERAVGKVNGAAHAWNKVLINDSYYIVDCTNGVIVQDGVNIPNRRYFLISDATYASNFDSVTETGEKRPCNADYDVYEKIAVNGKNAVINSTEEFETLVKSFDKVAAKTVISVKSNVDAAVLTEYAADLNLDSGNKITKIIALSQSGEAVIIIE